MIINKIFINNFGKFKNYSLEFKKNMQIIYGPNEAGKSTIMEFLKIMFYSRKYGEKSCAKDKEIRKKYAPRSGEVMKGSIEFLHNDNLYSIQKEISTDSPSKDMTLLRNLSTGQNISLGKKEEVGEYLFGIDVRSFERSNYIGTIGKNDFEILKNSKDTLAEKLISNLSDIEINNISSELIIKRISEAIKELKPLRGTNGKIFSLKSYINDLNNKIRNVQNLELNNLNLISELENINALRDEKKELATKINNYEEYLKFSKIREILEIIQQKQTVIDKMGIPENKIHQTAETVIFYHKKIDNISSRINELEDLINSENDDFLFISNDDMQKLNLGIVQKESIENKLKALKPLSENYNLHKSELMKIKNKYSKQKNGVIFLTVLNFTILILGIIFSKLPLILLCFVLSVLKLGLLIKNKKDSKKLIQHKIAHDNYYTNAFEDILKDILPDRNSINKFHTEHPDVADKLNILTKLLTNDLNNKQYEIDNLFKSKKCDSIQTYYENYAKSKSLDKMRNLYNNTLGDMEKLKYQLIEYLSDYKNISSFHEANEFSENIISNSKEILDMDKKISFLSNELNLSKSDMINLKNSVDKYEKNNISNIDKKCEIETFRNRLSELSNFNLEDKYVEIQKNIKLPDKSSEELTKELEKNKNKLSDMENYLESLQIALTTIEESADEIRKNFNPILNSKSSEIFLYLTNEKYTNLNIDKNYNIAVNNNNQYYMCETLSNGTIDQAYFALRIAVAELLSKENDIPIMIDDAFMQYDDDRLQRVLSFLKDYSKKTQIIIFTCHKYLIEYAKNNNIPTININ